MKITIEVPEKTGCAFLNYVYTTGFEVLMGCRKIDTDEIKNGDVIVCDPKQEV
jgi:hypothetical protein